MNRRQLFAGIFALPGLSLLKPSGPRNPKWHEHGDIGMHRDGRWVWWDLLREEWAPLNFVVDPTKAYGRQLPTTIYEEFHL